MLKSGISFDTVLNETKVIAILRHIPNNQLHAVLDALYDGGIRLAEITYDATGKVSDSETAAMIADAVIYTESRMLIGAGTVLKPSQLSLLQNAGGLFAISPHTDMALIAETVQLGLLSIPGAMTVSEAAAAYSAGADYVKLFPASVLGPDFCRQIAAPLPQIPLLAVSGIKPADMAAYLDAGIKGFGIGAGIVNPQLCRMGEAGFAAIRKNAEAYLTAAKREYAE
ncbi:MAG: bifunctional 4-hydroxy-2-oxoglutarate aldolase/2-dehydro-3-deoxy-phosphogluconate aldolase [Clostridia bacterium]|nr:bifunctional 4-hydroxy-2-oxoglutarate aldolase/2-dehydro-3-deoxy-phosphogluconate aldolase [Clostridia bacterium]